MLMSEAANYADAVDRANAWMARATSAEAKVEDLSKKLRNSQDDVAKQTNRAKKAEKGEAEAKAQAAELLAICEQLQASNEALSRK